MQKRHVEKPWTLKTGLRIHQGLPQHMGLFLFSTWPYMGKVVFSHDGDLWFEKSICQS